VSGARVTDDPALLAAAAELRTRVFVKEQGVDAALEADGRDEQAAQVVLERGGDVIGTARIFDTADTAVVGRVAIDQALRGQGLGTLVMSAVERWAGDQGLPTVELHARQPVIGFYERLGYCAVGDSYVEAGIPHLTMRKDLLPGLRPVRNEDAAAIEALIGGVWAEYPSIVFDVDGEEPWIRAPATRYEAAGELWVVDLPGGQGLLGCAGWRPDPARPGAVELKSLYVSARSRRQGWGSRLVHFIERRVGGRVNVTAWSDSRFLDSHQMYERLGYQRSGSTRELHDKSQTVEIEFVGQADTCEPS
jgi:predicted GNAT family N-acyltransferase